MKLAGPRNRRAYAWVDPDPGVERDSRLTLAPTYVLSVVEERWLHAREVGTLWRLPRAYTAASFCAPPFKPLSSSGDTSRGGRVTLGAQVLAAVLHLRAEHVTPPKPSAKLAREARKRHNYDKDADVDNVVTQRLFSLTVAWERLTRHIAHDTDMAGDDFAFVFEGDIALHDNVSHADARRAVLHGMDLARRRAPVPGRLLHPVRGWGGRGAVARQHQVREVQQQVHPCAGGHQAQGGHAHGGPAREHARGSRAERQHAVSGLHHRPDAQHVQRTLQRNVDGRDKPFRTWE